MGLLVEIFMGLSELMGLWIDKFKELLVGIFIVLSEHFIKLSELLIGLPKFPSSFSVGIFLEYKTSARKLFGY